MWGIVIGLFVSLWVLQILLTALQLKHYRKTIQEMSDRPSGYLGVGVDKRKLGVGSVVVIVCDNKGSIVESKKMHGVTVFQRFTEYKEIINKHINDHIVEKTDVKLHNATTMALANIKKQMQAS